MPTILIIGPYRFFFYSGENNEPIHIHIERDDKVAKFWINPVRLDNSGHFNRAELVKIFTLVEENQKLIKEKWNEYFGD